MTNKTEIGITDEARQTRSDPLEEIRQMRAMQLQRCALKTRREVADSIDAARDNRASDRGAR